jgi:hypothetical protein
MEPLGSARIEVPGIRQAPTMSSTPTQALPHAGGCDFSDETLPTPKSTRTERSVPKSTYIGIPACQDGQEMWMLCRSPQR